jgi:hypothetical protein
VQDSQRGGVILFSNMHQFVDRIRANDPDAVAGFHVLFAAGIRFYLEQQLGARELDTRLRDTLDTLLTKIRLGELHEPDTIMRFVPRFVHRQLAA